MSDRTDLTAVGRLRHVLRPVWPALAVVVLGVTVLLGCQRRQATAPAHTCLIVGLGEDDPLWPVIKAGARNYAANTRGLNLRCLAPLTSDPAAQADLARKNMDRTVTAVCLQSAGHDQTRRLVKDLTVAGTPVILIGQDMRDTTRFGHVGWDEFEAGKVLAAALKASLRDRTTFMVLHAGEAADKMYGSRLSGFGVGMQEYTFLRELHRFDCQADPAMAIKIMAEQSQRYPQLGAWACVEDWPARVSLDDLRRSLPAGTSLAIVGARPEVWPLLEQGLCPAAVGTDYGRWGYEAVSLSELAFRRAVKPGELRHTEPRIILADQLDQFKKEWAAWSEGKVPAGRPLAPLASCSR
jgi:ABC-type sugar transport system substrate-binding protein